VGVVDEVTVRNNRVSERLDARLDTYKRCCAGKSAMGEVEKAEHDDTKSGNSLAIES
jgi:hypothetical protein